MKNQPAGSSGLKVHQMPGKLCLGGKVRDEALATQSASGVLPARWLHRVCVGDTSDFVTEPIEM